jgi:hypothetical protein
MSIYISQDSRSYNINNIQNQLIINSSINDNNTLIKLNTNHFITETYIQIGQYVKLGSSNNHFVIKDIFDTNLINLSSTHIIFDQNIQFNNTLSIFDHISFFSTYTQINKNVIFNLENELFLIKNSNIDLFKIESNILSFNNCTSSNIYVKDTIYTHYIKPISDNIIIEGLYLENYKAINAIFKNNLILDFNELKDTPSLNKTSIYINKLNNTCNFVNLSTSNINKLKINNNGFIEIGNTSENNIPINIQTNDILGLQPLSVFKSNDNFSISQNGHISIGNLDFSKTLLKIHRNDNNIQNNILNEPIAIFSMDYSLENNYITSNIINTVFNSDNLIINILSNINENGYYLIFNLNFNNISLNNTQWITDGFQDLCFYNTINSNIGLILQINKINYGDYKLHYLYLRPNLSLITNSNNIKLVFGFSLSNPDILDIEMNNFLLPDYILNSNYILKNITYIQTLFLDNANFDNYDINFDIFIFIEKSSFIHTFNYINTIPILYSPPDFINFLSNNQNIGFFNSTGLLEIPFLTVKNNTILENVEIHKITNNINFDFHNLSNITQINVTDLFIQGTIYIGDIVKISSLNGLELSSGTNIESKITSVNISNINSPFFKYNNEQTSILNKFNIGSNLNTLNSLRENNDYNLLISGKGIYIDHFSPNIFLNGSEPYIQFFNNTLFSNLLLIEKRIYDIDDLKNTTFCLSSQNNTADGLGTTFWRNYNSLNTVSFGNDDFICLTTDKLNNKNKISIGIPDQYIYNVDIEYWYQYFKDIVTLDNTFFKDLIPNNFNTFFLLNCNNHLTDSNYMNHVFNVFGSSRFSNKKNVTLLEIRGDDLTLDTSTLSVYGNIKCSSKTIQGITSEALYAKGDISVEGKIYTTGGVSSLSDINVKTNIEIISNSIEKIKKITGYTYYRTDILKNDTGLIAQEVELILPEVIDIDKNSHKTISYGNMTGLIIEALKNINKRLEILEALT